ncbi:MAG: RNA 2'-phosphotransferase [Bacteroidia bacterium]|nr:RNA 2'-phosphotransferase [Bacteroidia bacterium]
MISLQEEKKISKFLSLVLRHKPEVIGVELTDQGWVDVALLIAKVNEFGRALDLDTLRYVVLNNAKQRFAFNDTGDQIRANQGHSIEVELGYQAQVPPEILYHGTGSSSVEAILSEGIHKMVRHHVHLSATRTTAKQVGQRHGIPVILVVNSAAMSDEGHTFFLSDNGVWLTDHVPAAYLSIKEGESEA